MVRIKKAGMPPLPFHPMRQPRNTLQESPHPLGREVSNHESKAPTLRLTDASHWHSPNSGDTGEIIPAFPARFGPQAGYRVMPIPTVTIANKLQ